MSLDGSWSDVPHCREPEADLDTVLTSLIAWRGKLWVHAPTTC
jgi:hypothetical protein